MSMDNHKIYSGGVSFSDVWKRITNETDINSLTKLGKLLGKTQQTISASKQKDLFPYGWAFPIAMEFNLLTEWILTGEGPKSLDDLEKTGGYNFQILKELDTWLTELVVKEPHRNDWFRGSLEDAFPMFKAWTKRKEEKEGQDPSFPEEKIA
jgi:hypothetical protein